MNLLNRLEADREQNRLLVHESDTQLSPSDAAARDVEEVTESLRIQFAEKISEITKHLK